MKQATQENQEPNKQNEQDQQTKTFLSFWHDKQHKELIFYLLIAILLVECIVGAVAFFYGIMHATPGINGGPPQFQFPWLAYILAAILTPACLLLIVQLTGIGLFRSIRGQEEDASWQEGLPARFRQAYAIIKGAPSVVLILGMLFLSIALFYFDGAMSALLHLLAKAEPYLPWIIGGCIGAWCVGYIARTWFAYRTRRMQEEYAFRREVLERTGVVIVDRGSTKLSLQEHTDAPKSLNAPPAGALSESDTTAGPVLDVTPQEEK